MGNLSFFLPVATAISFPTHQLLPSPPPIILAAGGGGRRRRGVGLCSLWSGERPLVEGIINQSIAALGVLQQIHPPYQQESRLDSLRTKAMDVNVSLPSFFSSFPYQFNYCLCWIVVSASHSPAAYSSYL